MTNVAILMHKLEALTPDDLNKVDTFLNLLIQKKNSSIEVAEPKEPPAIFGSAKGFFKPADDFNAPMDDISDYL